MMPPAAVETGEENKSSRVTAGIADRRRRRRDTGRPRPFEGGRRRRRKARWNLAFPVRWGRESAFGKRNLRSKKILRCILFIFVKAKRLQLRTPQKIFIIFVLSVLLTSLQICAYTVCVSISDGSYL